MVLYRRQQDMRRQFRQKTPPIIGLRFACKLDKYPAKLYFLLTCAIIIIEYPCSKYTLDQGAGLFPYRRWLQRLAFMRSKFYVVALGIVIPASEPESMNSGIYWFWMPPASCMPEQDYQVRRDRSSCSSHR